MEAKDRHDHQLTLAQLLKMLLADGLITEDMARPPRRKRRCAVTSAIRWK